VHDKARAEMLVADARQAVKEQAPLERVRSLTADLQQMVHGLAASGGAPAGDTAATGGGVRGDDVIDADYTPAG
jgi:molecular chaperone DnaK